MLLIPAVIVAALVLAALGYARVGWRAQLLPMALRGAAWAALGLLLVNPGCPSPASSLRPLVLLDASLSMTAAGGRWREALDSARQWGEVRPFGDPERQLDTVPDGGASRLAPALAAAAAAGRAVVVVTDGEVEDAAVIAGHGAATIRLFPRATAVAAAISRVEAPGRATHRDTVVVRASVRVTGVGARTVPVVLSVDGREAGRATVTLAGDGEFLTELPLVLARVPAGDRVLEVSLGESLDPEGRDDSRALLLSVSPVPGVVLLAAPGDWDARFLLRALRDVTRLPVEGYVQLDRSGWRRMEDLSPASDASVQEAAGGAELLVVKGAVPGFRRSPDRPVLAWPSAGGPERREGDWYLSPGPSGPVPGALGGLPVDSFPPTGALEVLPPGDVPAWVGLTAQLGRRGTPRPALVGYEAGGSRRAVVLADGLWRWAFRGGSSEQAYRAVVASLADWLLVPAAGGGAAVRPVRPVVPRGRPVLFGRAPSDTTSELPIRWSRGDGTEATDTLRFGADGRAALWAGPGTYRYLLPGGGGTFLVESWSPEWFPAPITLQQRDQAPPLPAHQRAMRDLWWLYALGVLAFCGEWAVRRRRGLR